MTLIDIDFEPRKQHYTGRDLAVIIPTKDRPSHLKYLLSSLCDQELDISRIIVVDSGESVLAVVNEFSLRLSIEYHRTQPGQIAQRRFGISLLDERTPLVLCTDDDMYYHRNSVREALAVFNTRQSISGVGFNNVSAPSHRKSGFRALFFMCGGGPGKVTLSGYNTSIAGLSEDTATQWLGGGYTIWKLDILKTYSHEDIETSWAIGEDVRFSYEVSKKNKMMVAHMARVEEYKEKSNSNMMVNFYYKGVLSSAAYYYFVKNNRELSKLACTWMLCGRALAMFTLGLVRLKLDSIYYAVGTIHVIGKIPLDLLRLCDARMLLQYTKRE